jgi:hypothetical protein
LARTIAIELWLIGVLSWGRREKQPLAGGCAVGTNVWILEEAVLARVCPTLAMRLATTPLACAGSREPGLALFIAPKRAIVSTRDRTCRSRRE